MLRVLEIAELDGKLFGVLRVNMEMKSGCLDTCDLIPGKGELASFLDAPIHPMFVESRQHRSEDYWVDNGIRNDGDPCHEVYEPEVVVQEETLNDVAEAHQSKDDPLNPNPPGDRTFRVEGENDWFHDDIRVGW